MQGKVTLEQNAMAPVYVGIDVCKAWLDVHIHPHGHEFRVPNDTPGFKQLRLALGLHEVAGVVTEATGKYHRAAFDVLHAADYPVAVVNPARARWFAKAKGFDEKTDRIDARMLALMAAEIKPAVSAPVSKNMEELQELTRARQHAVDDRTALTNQLGETKGKVLGKELKRRLTHLDGHIERLEAEIARLIAADPRLARRLAIVTSIPGVGKVAATWLIIGLPELGTCSARAAAKLAGLAPIVHESGQMAGQRHIRGGRGDVRRGIFMAALTATRHNPDLKAFYDRLMGNGKVYKVAITGVMRKLVVLANTLLTADRLWQPEAPKMA
jgi:transposase